MLRELKHELTFHELEIEMTLHELTLHELKHELTHGLTDNSRRTYTLGDASIRALAVTYSSLIRAATQAAVRTFAVTNILRYDWAVTEKTYTRCDRQ